MTDAPTPPAEPAETPPERVRVTAEQPPARHAVAPAVYVAGALVLALALFFLWRYPAGSRRSAEDSNQLATLHDQVASLSDRVGKLEGRTGPDLGPLEARVAALEGRRPLDLAPLEARVAAMEGRKPPDLGPLDARIGQLEARPPADLGPLEARVAQLEARPLPAPPDLSGIMSRIDTLARDDAASGAKQDADVAALRGRVDGVATDLGNRIAGVDAHVGQVERAEQAVTGLAARAERTARVQAAAAALDAGKPLGPVPGAPPALARFADAAPPTLASLRLGFADAADAARRASLPAVTGTRNVLGRAWTIAQQAVTVRQGDRVVVGDPVAGVLAQAQEKLEAGDLAGCLAALDGLPVPPRAAMSDWMAQAQALLDARAALAAMASSGATGG